MFLQHYARPGFLQDLQLEKDIAFGEEIFQPFIKKPFILQYSECFRVPNSISIIWHTA